MRYLSSLRPGILALVVLLASCGGSGNEVTSYYVRLVNTMVDSPAQQLNMNQVPLHTNIDYMQASGFRSPVSKGEVTDLATAELLIFLPSGDPTILASTEEYLFEADREYTINVAGTVADSVIFVTSNPRRKKPVTGAYVEFIHASLSNEALAVYLTAPDVPLDGVTPFAILGVEESSGSLPVETGSFQIRVTDVMTGELLFTSGTLDISGNAEWQFTITANINPMPSSLSLVAVRDGTTVVFQDKSSLAEVRGLMTSATSVPVDLYAADNLLVAGLSYPVASDYALVAPGAVAFKATAVADASSVLLETEESVTLSGSYSYLIGDSEGALAATLLIDDRRSLATGAKIRFVHAIATTAVYNVFLTTEIPTAVPPTSGTLRAASLLYGTIGRTTVAGPGEYYLVVTTRPDVTTTAQELLLEPELIQLTGGDVFTILISQTSTSDPTPVIRFVRDNYN